MMSDAGGVSTVCRLHVGVVERYNREGQAASDTAGMMAAHINSVRSCPGHYKVEVLAAVLRSTVWIGSRRSTTAKLGVSQRINSRLVFGTDRFVGLADWLDPGQSGRRQIEVNMTSPRKGWGGGWLMNGIPCPDPGPWAKNRAGNPGHWKVVGLWVTGYLLNVSHGEETSVDVGITFV